MPENFHVDVSVTLWNLVLCNQKQLIWDVHQILCDTCTPQMFVQETSVSCSNYSLVAGQLAPWFMRISWSSTSCFPELYNSMKRVKESKNSLGICISTFCPMTSSSLLIEKARTISCPNWTISEQSAHGIYCFQFEQCLVSNLSCFRNRWTRITF